jgi:uncharacterized delta-60 repeat protein
MKLLYLITFAILLNFTMTSAQTIDETFIEPVPTRPAKIYFIKVLPDNRLLIGGDISFFKDNRVNSLIRLNPDNTLDETFNLPADKKLRIRKLEFLSNGDMIILGNIDTGPEIFSDKWSLLHLGPNGDIKAEINTLLNPWSIAIQNDDKILVCSEKITQSGLSHFLYRLNSDFSPDNSFNSIVSANGSVTDVKLNNNRIYICGLFSKVNNISRNGIAVLNINGSVDASFDPGSGTSDPVYSITVQPDGKVLLGNSFINSYNGAQFHGMIRINPDGSADTGFTPPPINSQSSEIAIKDSSIFVAAYNQSSEYYLYKLNYKGLPYPGFIPVRVDDYAFGDFAIAFKDNDIIFNNSITTANKYGLSKCDREGNIINTFNPEVRRFGIISKGYYFNGKMLISGDFMKINNIETYGIAMLDKNGEPDEGFVLSKNPGKINQVKIFNDTTIFVSTGKSFLKLNASANILKDFDYLNLNYQILKFIVLKDGSIIATDANAMSKSRPDGSKDTTFNTGTGIDHTCTAVDFDMQGDKIIWGSDFNSFNGKTVHKLIRLNSDGSLDQSFDIGSGPSGVVFVTKVLTSGEIIAGGDFYTFNNANVSRRIVKLSKNGEIDNSFLNNLKYSAIQYPGPDTEIEQIDSVIYIKNSASIYALNLDGSDNTEFHLPFSITSVSDIIAMNDTVKVQGGRKSLAEGKTNRYLFALGSFIKSGNNDPSFIIKLSMDALSNALNISSSRIDLTAAANSSSTFTISSNVSWEISCTQDWLSVSEVSGSDNATITVTATANTSENQRTATITVTGTGVPPRTVTVVQASALTYIPEITDSDVKIWPVPVYDKINITYPGNDKPDFSIYSSTGAQIYSSSINSANTEVDVSDFTSGVYYLKIFSSGRKVITRKILKLK